MTTWYQVSSRSDFCVKYLNLMAFNLHFDVFEILQIIMWYRN
jgi:hypothetical protein